MQQKSSFPNCGNFIALGRRSSRPNSVEMSTWGEGPHPQIQLLERPLEGSELKHRELLERAPGRLD